MDATTAPPNDDSNEDHLISSAPPLSDELKTELSDAPVTEPTDSESDVTEPTEPNSVPESGDDTAEPTELDDPEAVDEPVAEEPVTDEEDDVQTSEPETAENLAPVVISHKTNGQAPASAQIKQPKKRRFHIGKRASLVLAVVLINVAVGGASTYLALNPKKVPPVAAAKTAAVVTKPKVAATAAVQPVDTTNNATVLHYVSKPLNLEFDYPVDWRIAGSAADDSSLSMSSPPFQFTDTAGKARVVTVELSIAAPTADGFSLVSDSDLIQSNSEALTYSNPTTAQRKQTYLSFENISTADSNAIGAMFVSGSFAYSTGQTTSTHDYKSVNPTIQLYINGCYSDHCQGLDEVSFTLDDWHTNPQLVKAKSIIQSLRLN